MRIHIRPAILLLAMLSACGIKLNKRVTKSADPLLSLSITASRDILNSGISLSDGINTFLTQDIRKLTVSAKLHDGRMIMAGGGTSFVGGGSVSVELFDPTANGGIGLWSRGPDLSTARVSHAGVLMNDGRFLVTGGIQSIFFPASTTPLNSGEIFNPTANSGAGSWTTTTTMLTARGNHQLVVLANGKVMAVGGLSGAGATTVSVSTEIFDQTANAGAGSWTAGPSLSAGRYNFTLTRLNDGRVLAVGGVGAASAIQNTVEIYDPAANAGAGGWSSGPALSVARQNHIAILLNNGRVLVAGGVDASGPLDSVEIFDPVANSGAGAWSVAPSMNVARTDFSLTKMADGRLLSVGGKTTGMTEIDSVEIYDATANAGAGAWTVAPSLLAGVRSQHTAALLDDGRVLVAATTNSSFVASSGHSTEVFTPTANGGVGAWYAGGDTMDGRTLQGFILLNDGRVLSAGGGVGFSTAAGQRVDFFDPTVNNNSGQWLAGPPLITAHNSPMATKLQDGRVLVVGSVADAEIFDSTANGGAGAWTVVPPMSVDRAGATATLLQDGRVLVVGGVDGSSADINSTEIFDPTANAGAGAWSAGPSLLQTRGSAFTATLLADGRVLVAGGQLLVSGYYVSYSTTEIFDPVANSGAGAWSVGPSMVTSRAIHRAERLPDGRVIVSGGQQDSSTILDSVEIFDPAANGGAGAWTTGPALPAPRYGHTMTLLNNGKLFVAGGMEAYATDGKATTWLLDMQANSGAGAWSVGPSMLTGRSYHQAAVLQDGRVLIEGGQRQTLRDKPTLISFFEDSQLTVGGSGNYTFSFLSGEGAVEHSPGTHQIRFLPWHAGLVTLQITDDLGNTGSTTFTVND